jgi:hypothetical protein
MEIRVRRIDAWHQAAIQGFSAAAIDQRAAVRNIRRR